MTDRILLIEDALAMRMIVESVVGPVWPLTCAGTLAEAEQSMKMNLPSLILLDVGLPDGDGFEFCKRLKANEQTRDIPVIFLTSKSDIEQRVMGLNIGADDYIVKPPEPKEFLARIEARLRRKPVLQTSFSKAEFHVDLKTQKISLKQADNSEREMNLTPTEFKLLVHFLRFDGKIVTREDLMETAWGKTVHVSTHTIDTHVSSLRKKLGETKHVLKAVVKKGYCFTLKTA